jgi:hypothetical protein
MAHRHVAGLPIAGRDGDADDAGEHGRRLIGQQPQGEFTGRS